MLTKLIEKYKKQYADELSKKYFHNMEEIGYTKEETIKYLESLGGNK